MEKKKSFILSIVLLVLLIPVAYILYRAFVQKPQIFVVQPTPCNITFMENHLSSSLFKKIGDDHYQILYSPTGVTPAFDNRFKFKFSCNDEIVSFKVNNGGNNISQKCYLVNNDNTTTSCTSTGCTLVPDKNYIDKGGYIICRNFDLGEFNISIEATKKQ